MAKCNSPFLVHQKFVNLQICRLMLSYLPVTLVHASLVPRVNSTAFQAEKLGILGTWLGTL